MPGKQAIALCAISITGLLCLSAPAAANGMFSLYDSNTSLPGNPALRQGGTGTGLTLRGVEWGGDRYNSASFYNVRISQFDSRHPNWGAALDFSHHGTGYSALGRGLASENFWRGPASGLAMPERQAQRMDISNGVNILSLNGIYRWQSPRLAGGRLLPYAGAGLAYRFSQADSAADHDAHDFNDQASGFGYQVLGGLEYRMTQRMAAFVEAKFNSGTGRLGFSHRDHDASPNSFRALAGFNYQF
jgi:opacity protein-like surface antigen